MAFLSVGIDGIIGWSKLGMPSKYTGKSVFLSPTLAGGMLAGWSAMIIFSGLVWVVVAIDVAGLGLGFSQAVKLIKFTKIAEYNRYLPSFNDMIFPLVFKKSTNHMILKNGDFANIYVKI